MAVDFPPGEVDDRIDLVCLPRPKVYVLGYVIFHLFVYLRLFAMRWNVDVLLFNQFSAPFLLPIAPLRRLIGWNYPKVVMDMRSVFMETSSARGKRWNSVFSCVQKIANRWADGQTAITKRMALSVGIPKQQLLGIWASGVRVERFKKILPQRRWPGNEDPVKLIYIGSLHKERGLLELSEAVMLAIKEGHQVKLSFYGEGPDRSELEKYSCKHGKGLISVHYAIPHRAIPALLINYNVGVLPFPNQPKYCVSSPIKLFEYMAAGMPVLATLIPCHTDVINDRYVFWAENNTPGALANAIGKLCTYKSELRDMGARAAVAAQEWTWEKTAGRLNKALQRALG